MRRAVSSSVSTFMAAVISDIEQLLTGSGAQIRGLGRGGNNGRGPESTLSNVDYYSIRYRQDRTEGAVNVWGVSGGVDSFTLIVLITESRTK